MRSRILCNGGVVHEKSISLISRSSLGLTTNLVSTGILQGFPKLGNTEKNLKYFKVGHINTSFSWIWIHTYFFLWKWQFRHCCMKCLTIQDQPGSDHHYPFPIMYIPVVTWRKKGVNPKDIPAGSIFSESPRSRELLMLLFSMEGCILSVQP